MQYFTLCASQFVSDACFSTRGLSAHPTTKLSAYGTGRTAAACRYVRREPVSALPQHSAPTSLRPGAYRPQPLRHVRQLSPQGRPRFVCVAGPECARVGYPGMSPFLTTAFLSYFASRRFMRRAAAAATTGPAGELQQRRCASPPSFSVTLCSASLLTCSALATQLSNMYARFSLRRSNVASLAVCFTLWSNIVVVTRFACA